MTEKARAQGVLGRIQEHSHQFYPYLLMAPALILIGVVSLYPTLYSFYLALTTIRKGTMVFVGLENFATILASRQFWQSLQLTLIFGVFYITLTMLISFLLALTFNRGLSLGALCMTLIFIPWVLSEITSGVMWRWMFYRDYGVLQNLIAPLFGKVTLIATPAGAMGIVTAASIWRSTAFTMLLLLAGLQTIPKEVYEAAAIDGATKWTAFWKVTWPLLRPTTLVTVVFLSIQVVNAVGMFLAITEGGPGRATEVLPLHMYREAIQYFHFGYGAALSVIMSFINATLAVIYIRSLRSESVWA
ncbi:MAG: carbohydrate ABC transporter permease [Anaerolineae bacterium]